MAKEHPAIAAGFEVNGLAIFKGYGQIEEGQETILEEGMPVRIERFEGEADIVVIGVDDEGNDILNADGTPTYAERVFPEELELAELDTAAEEPVVETAPVVEEKLKRARAAKAPAAEAPAAEAPAEAPAAAKPKAKPKAKPAAEAPAEVPAAEAAPAAKAKPKPKAKPAAEAPPAEIKKTDVVSITDSKSVQEIITEEGALAAAKSLVDRVEHTYFTLGGVLRNINETGAFKTIGYEGKRGFDDYVKITLGMEPRKARYLMSIYIAFAMIGIDETKLAAIGWSKAKELARIPAAELKRDFDKLIKQANEQSREELVAAIKKKYTVQSRGGADDRVSMTSFNFKLAEEDAKTVDEGLDAACALIGEKDLNKALVYIVGDWRGTGTGTNLSLEDTLELMVARFGLTKIDYTTADGDSFEYEPEADAEAEAIA